MKRKYLVIFAVLALAVLALSPILSTVHAMTTLDATGQMIVAHWTIGGNSIVAVVLWNSYAPSFPTFYYVSVSHPGMPTVWTEKSLNTGNTVSFDSTYLQVLLSLPFDLTGGGTSMHTLQISLNANPIAIFAARDTMLSPGGGVWVWVTDATWWNGFGLISIDHGTATPTTYGGCFEITSPVNDVTFYLPS